MDCRDTQNRLLEEAYGLLDDAEAAGLRSHLAGCQPCTSANAETRKLQNLLSRAAKMEFDSVTFTVPASEVSVKPRPRSWAPWVLAAGVLLAIGGLGVSFAPELFGPKPEVAAINTEIDKNKPKEGPTENGRNLREGEPHEWTATTKEGALEAFRVLVIGPGLPNRGSDNTYSVTAMDAAKNPIAVRVTMYVKTPVAGVVLKQSFESGGQYVLKAAEFAKLESETPTLHVLATHPTSGDKVQITIPLK